MSRGRGAVAAAVAVVVAAGACSKPTRDVAAPPPTTTATAPTSTTEAPTTTTVRAQPTGEFALASFTSCSTLLRHIRREATKLVQPYGLPFPSGAGGVRARALAGSAGTAGGDAATAEAAPMAASSDSGGAGGASFSGTNIQETGVDEPDIVKTDGRRLVTVTNQTQLRIVDLTTPTPTELSVTSIPPGNAEPELLLVGDRVLVLSLSWPKSTVQIVDIADPRSPKTVATLTLDGQYVSARLAAGVVRLVVAHQPSGPELALPTDAVDSQQEADALVAAHKAKIRRSTIRDWLPSYSLERPGRKSVTAPMVPCASVLRPKEFAGLSSVSVLTIDPADPKPDKVACVLGGGDLVYASPQNLYVATNGWRAQPFAIADVGGPGPGPGSAASSVARQPEPPRTQLHQFAIPGREPAQYVGSGEVPGQLLNQFSMSEHDGHLRVAATVWGPNGTDNSVAVLKPEGGRLNVVGTLKGLGHEFETIHSVRFLGTRGYVVTFRQTDPLYVLDLTDPRKPRTVGELQVPGFSSYLHPLSDSALLGVGQGPGGQGGQGLQVSLFDVRDPAHPVRLANKVFDGWSSAQQNHHAFLWWPAAGKLVLPFQGWVRTDGTDTTDGRGVNAALVLPVDPAKGFGPETLLDHEGEVRRAMVSEGRLLTISTAGLLSTDVQSLARRSWTPWR